MSGLEIILDNKTIKHILFPLSINKDKTKSKCAIIDKIGIDYIYLTNDTNIEKSDYFVVLLSLPYKDIDIFKGFPIIKLDKFYQNDPVSLRNWLIRKDCHNINIKTLLTMSRSSTLDPDSLCIAVNSTDEDQGYVFDQSGNWDYLMKYNNNRDISIISGSELLNSFSCRDVVDLIFKIQVDDYFKVLYIKEEEYSVQEISIELFEEHTIGFSINKKVRYFINLTDINVIPGEHIKLLKLLEFGKYSMLKMVLFKTSNVVTTFRMKVIYVNKLERAIHSIQNYLPNITSDNFISIQSDHDSIQIFIIDREPKKITLNEESKLQEISTIFKY
jgi:hypothetical protein